MVDRAKTTLTVAPGQVSGTLSNFVVRIDLSMLPDGWWGLVDAAGAGIRVRNGGVDVPRDLVHFDPATSTGELYALLGSVAVGDTVDVVATEGSAPAHTDLLGRHAVWADYETVRVFWDTDDRTGNATSFTHVGSSALSGDGRLQLTGGYGTISGLPTLTTWVMSATHSPIGTTGQDGILSYSTNDSSNANRMTWLRQNTGVVQLWNSTDLFSGGNAQHSGRGWALQTPTTRALYLDTTDAGPVTLVTSGASAQRPQGAADTLFVGVEDTDATEVYSGHFNRVYLRDGTLSAAWVQAENNCWEFTETFWLITAGEAPPARLFPRGDGLGVGSGRHFPPSKSQQRSGRRFGYY